MSALGQKQTSSPSADDIDATQTDVRFVPIADMAFAKGEPPTTCSR
jgi:hypothetical protein